MSVISGSLLNLFEKQFKWLPSRGNLAPAKPTGPQTPDQRRLASHEQSHEYTNDRLLFLVAIPSHLQHRFTGLLWQLDSDETESSRKYERTYKDQVHPLLSRIKETLFYSLDDTHFTVKTLDEKLLLSRTQLYRKVKELWRDTPHGLIQNFGLEQAKELLISTDDQLQIIGCSGF